jgi:hypothetical protein
VASVAFVHGARPSCTPASPRRRACIGGLASKFETGPCNPTTS